FVIESLGDLKPDPVESSTKVLEAMSQTLIAIANGQNVSSPISEPLDTTFSPSRTAVLVNLLWILSLSLSVAVSLVAMLAKEWCYKFMSGRSGPVYEQGRRRQQKWNGIEKWKMKAVVTYLPGVMHVALLLFAVGLCLYLWNVNITVAIPLVAVTSSATLVYLLATVLPLVDNFCPYNTPALSVFLDTTIPLINLALSLTKSLESFWEVKIKDLEAKLAPRELGMCPARLMKVAGTNDEFGDVYGGNTKVPMDLTTSQMLAWLIVNCEDSRSINIALQAIAGADGRLPGGPLAECYALERALLQLKNYLGSDDTTTALRYYRACGALVSGGTFKLNMDQWSGYSDGALRKNLDLFDSSPHRRQWSIYFDSIRVVNQVVAESDSNTRAAIAVTMMPFFHWERRYDTEVEPHRRKALSTVIQLLGQHLQSSSPVLSPVVFAAATESIAHYLVGHFKDSSEPQLTKDLTILLVHAFFASYDTYPDVAHDVAIALAVTAFVAQDSTPRDQTYFALRGEAEEQAVATLNFYKSRPRPNKDETLKLFLFSFFGVLPTLNLKASCRNAAMTNSFNKFMERIPRLEFDAYWTIHGLQEHFSPREKILKPAYNSLSSVVDAQPSIDDEAALVFKCLPLLIHTPNRDDPNPELYISALIALCRAKSAQLRILCLHIIDAQLISSKTFKGLTWSAHDHPRLLRRLCRTLLDVGDTCVYASAVALHLGLLIATVVSSASSMTSNYYVNDSSPGSAHYRSVLRPLLAICDWFSKFKPASELTKETLMWRLDEIAKATSVYDRLRPTLQSVRDFCDAGLPDMRIPYNLYDRLSQLKNDHKMATEEAIRLARDRETASSVPQASGSTAIVPETSHGAP
ncbi:hypothetical protein FRC07_007062, partial [Ceratobasidium sp. 392]